MLRQHPYDGICQRSACDTSIRAWSCRSSRPERLFELGGITEGTALLEPKDETSQRLNIVYLPVGQK